MVMAWKAEGRNRARHAMLRARSAEGAAMNDRPAIGSIAPSSNRVVERTLAVILRRFPGLDSCVARIPFHGAGLGQPKDGYDSEPYRHAAWQLAMPGSAWPAGTARAARALASTPTGRSAR